MLVKRCGVSKIRNVKLRAFPLYNDWARVLQLHSEELAGCLQGGVDRQPEEEAR